MRRGGSLGAALAGASKEAAAASALLQAAPLQGHSLASLRLLSGAAVGCSSQASAIGAAAAAEEAAAAERRQRSRRLSHYSASTSSPGPLAAAALPHSTRRAAAAGSLGGLAGCWRRGAHTSAPGGASAGPPGGRPRATSPERSFASQPAYAYAELEQCFEDPSIVGSPPGAASWQAEEALLRAQAAAAVLRAEASARFAEVAASRQQAPTPSLFGGMRPSYTAPRRTPGQNPAAEINDLVKTTELEEVAPEVPIWERLVHSRSMAAKERGAPAPESLAALHLHLYRQEVLHGHDSEALTHSQAGRNNFGHVPFLHSGMFAAQQGFGLQSELSRSALHARLMPAVQLPPPPAPEETSSVSSSFDGSSSSSGGEAETAQQAAAEAEPAAAAKARYVPPRQRFLANLDKAAAAAAASGELAPTDPVAAALAEVRQQEAALAESWAQAAAAEGHPWRLSLEEEAAAAAAPAAAEAEEEAQEALLWEEHRGQGGLLEELEWQSRLQHENFGERVAAAERLKARRRQRKDAEAAARAAAAQQRADELAGDASASAAAAAVGQEELPVRWGTPKRVYLRTKIKVNRKAPPPSAPQEEVAAMLRAAVPGLEIRPAEDPEVEEGRALSQAALEELFSGARMRVTHDVVVPDDPQLCLERMQGMARVLSEDLGLEGFCRLINEQPWLLLLDPERHGASQLAVLHRLDMPAEGRAAFLQRDPSFLQEDAEGRLVPLLEYLQSLGVEIEQLRELVSKQAVYATKPALANLKAFVALMRGKGMSQEGLIMTVATTPEMLRWALTTSIQQVDLQISWLLDHVQGFVIEDVALMHTCFWRCFTGVIAPRVAFALQKGVGVNTPSMVELARTNRRNLNSWKLTGGPSGRTVGLRGAAHHSVRKFLNEMCGCKKSREELDVLAAEFLAFREKWVREDLPAWAATRKPAHSIEHYRSLTQPLRRQDRTAAAAGRAAVKAAAGKAAGRAARKAAAKAAGEAAAGEAAAGE